MSLQDSEAPSPAADAIVELSGTLDHKHNTAALTSGSSEDTIASGSSSDGTLVSDTAEAPATREDEQALEWHEVIELQAFSERKAWIEDKIKFLATLPPIEVFVGLDAVRESAEEVPGLPSRSQLQDWLLEHDRIEKETEIFDSGELKKLKKFTKAAAQRNLSPADTDLIELTLTTIYELDKLLHLLRDRSDNLDLLGVRLAWEERRVAAWVELRSIVEDLQNFLVTRARWSPSVYDEAIPEEDQPVNERGLKRRNSVVSIASVASDTSLARPGLSRGVRFKLAELLSREAAQFASRTSSLRHTKIAGAGKALDKLIDHSRKPVPEELLDEQDKLENKGINEMEDVGKFVMNVVMQWKKADEVYVETLKDKAAAQNLLEELEVAMMNHPNPRQDTAFLSRSNALVKRVFMRGNPASSSAAFPNPIHSLYPDQHASNDSIVHLLSTELSSAVEQAKKVESVAKEYHTSLEAVKRVEIACKTSSDLSSQMISIVERLDKGMDAQGGDGTPPDVSTEACLDSTRHSVFLAMLPTVLQELDKANEDANALLPSARAALLHLDHPGIDEQFRADSAFEIQQLETRMADASRIREQVVARASLLSDVRHIWSDMSQTFEELEAIRGEIVDAMEKQMWRQQARPHDAPPTPESPTTSLPPSVPSYEAIDSRLDHVRTQLEQQVLRSSAVSSSVGIVLNDYMSRCSAGLSAFLSRTQEMGQFWSSVHQQATAMIAVQEEVHGLQIQLEDLKLCFENTIEDVLSGSYAGANLDQSEEYLNHEKEHCQNAVRAFNDALPQRVPFVGHAHIVGGVNVVATKKRFSLTGSFSPDMVQQAALPDFPFDPAALDRAVRADSNSFSMLLSGGIKSLEQKADHLRLAKTAKALDVAVASILDSIQHVADAVSTIQHSLHDTDTVPRLQHFEDLVSQVDALSQTEGVAITSSLSPVRDLLQSMKVIPGGSEPGVRESLVISRQRNVDDVEARYVTWRENVSALRRGISDAIQAEHAKLAAEERLKQERERADAEDVARTERERVEAELRALEEQERLEKERIETERRQRVDRERADEEQRLKAEIERLQAEQRARVERERLDAEARDRELERVLVEERERIEREQREAEETQRVRRQAEEIRLAQASSLESVQEESFSVLQADQSQQIEEDVFGLRLSPPKTRRGGSQQLNDLQIRILSIRKRLWSIHINDIARPGPRSDLVLPSDTLRSRMDKELSAVVAEVNRLPATVTDQITVDTELRSLRSEVAASVEMMEHVHNLSDLALSLHHCDECLSDLLEHIDSYPSPPLGMLATSHASDTSLPPEDQLSARIEFTRNAVDDMVSHCSTVAEDPRTGPERERIWQTWSELEAMGLDRVNGQKSRPPSVVSSASSSKTTSTRRSTVASKKSATYSRLSISSPAGSPQPRFLAPPPPPARRSVSGSSTGHTRTSSRATSNVSARSVSGPLSSSSTLYGTTFASRQRTASITSNAPSSGSPSVMQPAKRVPMPPVRPRAQTAQRERTASPALSDTSSFSLSRSGIDASRSSTGSRTSWARAPRLSFPTVPRPSPPRAKPASVKKPYVANPKNKLDVAVGDVVNKLPVNINIEVVADTWKDQSGKYWIGDQDPKLCFCRILRSQTVMVRVGGGWSELSKFIKEHFADAFRILPDSPPRIGSPSRLGSREEKWISSTTLSQAVDMMTSPTPPRTPEPQSQLLPSFALVTPSGKSPQSLKSTPSPSPGSPLAAMQFLRRVDQSPSARPETPSRSSRSAMSAILNSPARGPVWRP